VPIQPSHISPEELQFIQNTLPTWLTEVEAKCASKCNFLLISVDFYFYLDIREDIRRLKHELKQLYDEPQLKQVKTNQINVIRLIYLILGALYITCCLCT
jgi:hypothetical protein